jgi:CubicO group peptidase (beta-lactamase class C family)
MRNEPSSGTTTTASLQSRLDQLAVRHHVPGAVVGVLSGGEATLAATGVINHRTGVETTTDTLFQIGSVTKVWTATALAQLVAERRLDIDDPVRRHLPEFRVADPETSERVTIRHLLCHTSGIAGDLFVDTGRGDDCVERYVGECADLEQVHPLGATISYCNSGYVVLGRILEVLDGTTWDRVMRRRLYKPLGLQRTVTMPEHALLHRTAVGHVVAPEGTVGVTPIWSLPRSTGPAGAITSSAGDVLAFAAMHLSDDGLRWMQEPQVTLPDRWMLGDQWALGWILMDWEGGRVIGHDGSTTGQTAFLRIVPDAGVAIVLLCNGGDSRMLYQDLFGPLLAELAGVQLRRLPESPAEPAPVDLDRYADVWGSLMLGFDLRPDGGVLRGWREGRREAAPLYPRRSVVATPVDESLFVMEVEGEGTPVPAVFYDGGSDGRPQRLHLGARALTRMG